jgi:hypothetical protein
MTQTDSSATEARPGEIQQEREAIVNKSGDIPGEVCSLGISELWTLLRYFEQLFVNDMLGLISEQTGI